MQKLPLKGPTVKQLKQAFGNFIRQKDDPQNRRRNLIRREAKIGGQLFGAVPTGVKREFFCLDEYTWVWHEQWVDTLGKNHSVSTRYDVRPSGVLKSQNGHYQPLKASEALHLRDAAHAYQKRVMRELYSPAV